MYAIKRTVWQGLYIYIIIYLHHNISTSFDRFYQNARYMCFSQLRCVIHVKHSLGKLDYNKYSDNVKACKVLVSMYINEFRGC